jgi:NADH-quinone oxidoreductase subunit H
MHSPAWLNQLFEQLGLTLPPELLLVLWAVMLFTGIAILGQAAVVFMVLMERKVLAWLTQRKGPNRVGPWGLLQTLADGVKLLFKEDIMTSGQDKLLFTLAPAIFFLPVFVLYALVPFTDQLLGTSLPTGALFLFALSSISVIGIVLAGWASNNKYSLIGGMRSAAQAISYEIPLVMAVLGVVLYTGTMNIHQIVQAQSGPIWTWFWFALTPISFVIFLISSIAEVNRIPFDLPEAESELVSGYNTEYSGMKFAMFFLAEYAALFLMSSLTVAFFFGGYYSPFGGLLVQNLGLASQFETALQLPGFGSLLTQLEMVVWMLLKTYIFIFIAMWIRASLPRLKPDQLMGFSWKFLIPLSLINVFTIALQKQWVLTQEMTFFWLWIVGLLVGFGGYFHWMSQLFKQQLKARFVRG